MPNHPAEPAIPRANEVKVGPCRQDVELQTQKFVKAVQKSSAKGILQEDQIHFLTTINNEAKVRRSTKSLVLGKAKVMNYEDLEEARAKRAEKESTQEAKGQGKRGRKRKSAALEAPELRNKMARISRALKPAGAPVTQVSGTQDAEDVIAPEPLRAPVARM